MKSNQLSRKEEVEKCCFSRLRIENMLECAGIVGALIRTIWWLSRDPWVVRHRQPESGSLPPIQKLPYANAPTNILIEGFFLFPCGIED